MLEKTAGRKKRKKDDDSIFRVRDYPFFYMHWIITRNNQNIGEVVREFGVTPTVWRILALLQERDGISISELSELSLIDRTLLSRLLSELEEKGYIRKRVDPGDKRFVGIFLAPGGAKKFSEILPHSRRQIERAIAGLDPAALTELSKILSHIMKNLSRSPLLDER